MGFVIDAPGHTLAGPPPGHGLAGVNDRDPPRTVCCTPLHSRLVRHYIVTVAPESYALNEIIVCASATIRSCSTVRFWN